MPRWKTKAYHKMAGNSVLVVPPFECAWLMGDEVRFAEAGRGCVAFEARADNDVTVVFKEHAGMFWMPQSFVTLNSYVHFSPPL